MGATIGAAQSAAPPQKKVKDQAEFDLFDAVKKDLLAGNGAKAVDDLNAWKQHYPDSDYKEDREVMYMTAYQIAKQWDKMLDKAKELISHDLDAMFPDPAEGPKQVVKVLFGAVTAASALPNPTPDQLAVGVDAAHKLLAYKREPAGLAPGAWADAMKQVSAAANALLYRAAIAPAVQAQQARDYPGCEAAWTKAMADYPGKALIAYNLGCVYAASTKTMRRCGNSRAPSRSIRRSRERPTARRSRIS